MMLNWTNLIEYALYNVTHWLIDLVFAIIKIARYVKISLRWYLVMFMCLFISPARRTKNIKYLLKPEKIPNHIGIIINEETISLPDISNIIFWCICLGVRHVSVYDARGYVKTDASILYYEVLSRKEEYFRNKADRFNITFHLMNQDFSNKQVERNGHKVEDYYIHLLSQEDGVEQILHAVQDVCRVVKKKPSLLSRISVDFFDSYVQSEVPIPEPELIVLFGSNCLMGYLPWHVRLSEIISASTHLCIELQEFINILNKYELCEQRFGK